MRRDGIVYRGSGAEAVTFRRMDEPKRLSATGAEWKIR
jgi:hypothetical protein